MDQEAKRKAHNRSADSGKSSGSPASKSSRSNSTSGSSTSDADLAVNTDSLESPQSCGDKSGNQNTVSSGVTGKQQEPKMNDAAADASLLAANADDKLKNNGNNSVENGTAEKSMLKQDSPDASESQKAKSLSKINAATAQLSQSSISCGGPKLKQQYNNNSVEDGEILSNELQKTTNAGNKTQVNSTKTSATSNGNNNYSGLNLNMTASEMRELIASKKKFDPKKAQINIRQKYEIIQQM